MRRLIGLVAVEEKLVRPYFAEVWHGVQYNLDSGRRFDSVLTVATAAVVVAGRRANIVVTADLDGLSRDVLSREIYGRRPPSL